MYLKVKAKTWNMAGNKIIYWMRLETNDEVRYVMRFKIFFKSMITHKIFKSGDDI